MSQKAYIPEGASEREAQIRRQVHAQAEFYRHAMTYAIVIPMLWALNLFQTGLPSADTPLWRYWAIWPTLGWGIGLAAHGFSALPRWGVFNHDWEERKVTELMQARDQ